MNDSFETINTNTGLYLPTIFSVLFNHEVARSRRYPSPLSLLLISICQPAPLTDEIRESAELMVAQVLNTKLRQTDVCSHYGEDFLILLTNTDLTGAKIAARRLLDGMHTRIMTRQNEHFEIGVCAGLASHSGGSNISPDILLKQVSLSLQEARNGGPGSLVAAST